LVREAYAEPFHNFMRVYVNKHEAKCTLRIVQHLLLFNSLLELKI